MNQKKNRLPNLTATEPSKQTSAIRKKQNVGHRRPHLNNKNSFNLYKKKKTNKQSIDYL